MQYFSVNDTRKDPFVDDATNAEDVLPETTASSAVVNKLKLKSKFFMDWLSTPVQGRIVNPWCHLHLNRKTDSLSRVCQHTLCP